MGGEADWTERAAWAAILTGTPDIGLWEVDRTAGTVARTPAVLQVLGYAPEADALRSVAQWTELLHPADREPLRQAVARLGAGGPACFEAEFRARRVDGSWCWLLARVRAVAHDVGGAPRVLAGTLVDISRRRQLEDELRGSRARLLATLDSTPFDLWMIGEDGRYEMQNAASRRLWGDIVGKRPDEIGVSPETLAVWRDNNRRALAGETIRAEVQFPVQGEPRYLYNVVAPILEGERTLGILGINVDITERKRAEEALQQRNLELRLANEELERLSRKKDRLTAMMSHELRTPLVTGLGYVHMLLEGQLGPVPTRMRTKMAKARKSLERLARLIDGLLRYQQLLALDEGQLAPGEPFALGPLVEELRHELDGAASRIAVRIAPGTRSVVGNRELIRMALANLITNALKYAGSSAAVAVAVGPGTDGRVAVAVIDDGAGMPPEVQASAFEPFVRASPEGDGFGLGLPVVKAILRAHGTRPALASAPGRGTRISFSLAAAA